ncbi:MAG TPA: tetratricopeptide repeat protein [Polyangia bacterium]|nr:tetratricopeptide repeat protein [Polyangia bacterium]
MIAALGVALGGALILGAPDGGAREASVPSVAPTPAISAVEAAPPAPLPGARAMGRTEHAQGMARLRAGNFAEAAELFGKAAEHDPTNAAFATDLGFALGRAGRRVEAEAVLRGAIEKDPHRYYAYVNLADLLSEDPARWERRDAIVVFLDKGLEALKDDRKGHFNLLLGVAGFERAVGRTAAARARLQPLLGPDAPPLTRAQRKRVLDLVDGIALDERAQALADWPTPSMDGSDRERAAAATSLLGDGRVEQALPILDALCARYPSAAPLRVRRAQALEALGRLDEAARDLEIAVNLAPSSAEAWRALGRLLAAHGGALELDRADEALRQALTLEPAWADLRQLRAQIARRRAAVSPPPPRSAPPSEHARALYQQAEEWIDVGDPIGMGRDLVEEALDDSPGFVAAAISLYALGGAVPPATVDALHDDGAGLWALASGVRKLAKAGAETEALVRPWIDRAVELDVQEARFARAVARASTGERAGALADLVAYVAREPNPEHLAEARALRAGLDGTPADPRGIARAGQLSPLLLARIRLLEDRPEAARRALGGDCAPGLPADRLVAIGLVEEHGQLRSAARRCYVIAATAAPDDDLALTRLARIDVWLPEADVRADRPLLERAAARGIAAAPFALARLPAAAGDDEAALAGTRRALALAAGASTDADIWIPAAREAEQRWSESRQVAAHARRERRRRIAFGGGMLGALALALLARRRWRGRTLEAALRRRPALFPEVARAVGELRHDVLKHRAGVIGAVDDPQVPAAEIARALMEPRPTSAVVAGIYERLEQAARGAGAPLRPLGREPIFGALCRDLARAEHLAGRSNSGPWEGPAPPAMGSRERSSRSPDARLPREGRDELMAIDKRLRGPHADALDALLQMGPRTRLDAAMLSRWISGVEAETRQAGRSWTAPGLSLADLDLDFPVEVDALGALFGNLLRNAVAAVAGAPEPRVVVRADRERDVTGRLWVTLFVADSAPAPLTLESIEARESGRGLAIVRDLVRAWRGHLVVRPEPSPLAKLVGASFPL